VTVNRNQLMAEIAQAIVRWQDATQAFDQAVGARLDLGAAERRCLAFLQFGPQTAGAVATETGLSPAAVTALVDRLERRGLVARVRQPEDRRKVHVAMTERARADAMAYYGPIAEQGQRLLEGFGDAELAVISRFVRAALELQQRQTAGIQSKEG
jgi:DNA-binding MarR family transcriptional regulator